MGYNYLIERKTLWEKKKLLVTSNFVFAHNICLLRAIFFPQCFPKLFSSPEHEVLMVSYWDSAVSVVRRASSVVNFLPCVRSRGHSFGRILMKVGQDVCFNEISDEFENGSCGVKN